MEFINFFLSFIKSILTGLGGFIKFLSTPISLPFFEPISQWLMSSIGVSLPSSLEFTPMFLISSTGLYFLFVVFFVRLVKGVIL